ncbi:MAG: GNAT family N-acyltransferase [Pseudomonadota bacterium]
MPSEKSHYHVRLAETEADLRAAQRLRYEVFVAELGGDGPEVDHENRLERDELDGAYDHLILSDDSVGGAIVGVYRIMRDDQVHRAGRYYSASEYDLGPILSSGRSVMELGRSCVAKDHRGGLAMFHLWKGLAQYIDAHGIEVLFGVASFHGTDIDALAQPLSLLHHRHLAPEALRVRALAEHYQPMNLMPEDIIDRRAAMREVPALIKAYLRLGGCVGDGAYIDHAFNTIDVCLVMDTAVLSERHRMIYSKGEVV